MKTLVIVPLFLFSTGLSAQDLRWGGQVSFTDFEMRPGQNYFSNEIQGSVVVQYGAFGGQIDLTTLGFDGRLVDTTGADLHLFYDVTPDLTLGVFYSRMMFSNGSYEYFYGVEGSYLTQILDRDVSFEAFAGHDGFPGTPDYLGVYGLRTDVALANGFGGFVDIRKYSFYSGVLTDAYWAVGATWKRDNWAVEASSGEVFASTSDPTPFYTLAVSYSFGAGRKFHHRTYTGIWGGY